MHVPRKLVAVVAVSSVAMGGLGLLSQADAQSKHRNVVKSKIVVPKGFPIVDGVEEARVVYAYQQAVMWNALGDLSRYFSEVQAQINAERAQEEADRAEAARMAAEARNAGAGSQQQVSSPLPQVGAGSMGACGGATNGADQYIHRESGGNPAIFNTGGSGAYGCYQIMPATWASSCGDLGPEVGSSPATQAACASRLPLSAWGG